MEEQKTIIEILMQRDGMTYDDAKEIFDDLREQALQYVEDGDLLGLEDLLMDEVGLEPDYLFEIIDLMY